MKLVVFDRDWADEFSPFGFAIMDAKEFDEFREYYSKPQEWSFGTNEGFEDEVLIGGCEVTDISQEETDILIRLFKLPDYKWDYRRAGLFPNKPEVAE